VLLLLVSCAGAVSRPPDDPPVEQRWAAIFIDGRRTGRLRMERTFVQEEGRTLVVTRREETRNLDGEKLRSRFEMAETEAGTPVRFELVMGGALQIRGEVEGKTLTLTTNVGGEPKGGPAYFHPTTLGPYGLESLRAKQGLLEGTTYGCLVLDPDLPIAAVWHTYTVKGTEAVHVLGEWMDLTRIDVELDLLGYAEVALVGPGSIWVDGSCQVRKERYDIEGIRRVHLWGSRERVVE
jgi:hypothetical protein